MLVLKLIIFEGLNLQLSPVLILVEKVIHIQKLIKEDAKTVVKERKLSMVPINNKKRSILHAEKELVLHFEY